MIFLSSVVLASSLFSLSKAAPGIRSAVQDTVEGTFVKTIGYGKTPPDFVTSAANPPRPEILQLTPEEFENWVANDSHLADLSAGLIKETLPPNLKRTVIGNDDRFYQGSGAFPWGSIGRLYIPLPDGWYAWCSGTLVGPRLMASARHCIEPDARYFQFSPGYNDGDRYPTAFATRIVSLAIDESIEDCDLKNDWALYVLDQPLGQQRGYFQVGDYAADESTVANNPLLYNAGYPIDREVGQHLYMSEKRTTSRSLKSSCANGGPIIGDCDVASGMSGGPLWRLVGSTRSTYGTLYGMYIDDDGNELASIHAHGQQFVQGIQQLNAQYPA